MAKINWLKAGEVTGYSSVTIEETVLSDESTVYAVLIEAAGQHIRLHARDLEHACDIQLAVEAAHDITD